MGVSLATKEAQALEARTSQTLEARSKTDTTYKMNKEEKRAYSRKYYQEHKEEICARWHIRYQKRRAVINRYKQIKSCAICGNKDFRCLEFHAPDGHLGRAVSVLVIHSWAKAKAEITRCIVVCANCHKILHYEEKYGNYLH